MGQESVGKCLGLGGQGSGILAGHMTRLEASSHQEIWPWLLSFVFSPTPEKINVKTKGYSLEWGAWGSPRGLGIAAAAALCPSSSALHPATEPLLGLPAPDPADGKRPTLWELLFNFM